VHVLVGAGVEDPALLERSDELSALEAALAGATGQRRGRVVLVRGEAGIGKTLLLRRFCEEVSARVLWAACDPLFTPRPLGPLLDVARDAGPELQACLEQSAPPHDVAAVLLDELAGPAPNVLVIEDLHWADEATFDVVRLVARRIERVPALLVVSYRDEQVHRTHPLRLLLGELDGAERLDLAALSPEAVATLAEPAGLDARELYRRTEGNPFFVTEVVAAGG
jgi:predicted ATPase